MRGLSEARLHRGDQCLPALTLLDIKMPEMDGFEVLRWIKSVEALSAMPVVILSASGLDLDVQEAMRLGADSYLVKPSKFEDLIRVVGGLQKHWAIVD